MLQANTKKSKPASCRRQYYWDGGTQCSGQIKDLAMCTQGKFCVIFLEDKNSQVSNM